MKLYFSALCFLFFVFGFSQTNTEIFLFDLENNSSMIELKNVKNLSNNEGYDNQPSFINDRYIVFASMRNGQTDIAKYDTRYDSKSWVNFSEGGEYTPLKIPHKDEVSAVRLDKDGKQRLYTYNLRNGESKELINNLVVAYYTWYNKHTVVSAVIEKEQLNLFVSNLLDGSNIKHATNVGRSFHRIPNSNLVSFISKENKNQWQIKSLNPLTGKTKVIANTIQDVEDICWLDSKTLLSGKNNLLYKLRLKTDTSWKQIANLGSDGITKITRLIVNTEGNKLLIAGDVSTQKEATKETEDISEESSDNSNTNSENTTNETNIESIIQRNLNAYNARDINAFMKDYADDVKLYQYPNTLQTEGKEAMRKNYNDWFNRVKDLRAFVKKRIIFGNKVIDEEQVTANGQILNVVAIYEVKNGKIIKVTFMQ
ncbi:hypothetical protein BXY80_2046 [Ichthyenterobacterium magnum]|uniref:SnoaL-like domain-containing protein n=2 Tax=Ichthyenterobacterium magnum TaxID=1230530 RepID=A0A420DLE6_9FLAO|nr:hypothetical protein BXY80_2046 [Ichthyenterobacterium magnum]